NFVSLTNNISNNNASYPCTPASFVYLAGELFAPPNSAVNGGTLNLAAIVQPIVSGAAAPTGTVTLIENAITVASAPLAGRITPLQIANISEGTHAYTAKYGGDANYAPLTFGSYTLAGTSITLTPSASAVVYGTPVTVSVHVGAASGVPAGNVSVSD